MSAKYRQLRQRICLLVAMLVLSKAGIAEALLPPGSHQAAAPIKVIIETDIGDDIDDVYALSLALSSPEFNVLGVMSAWGDTVLRSRMLDRLLCETGRSEIPVLNGVDTTTWHKAGAAEFSQAAWAKAGIEHTHGDAVPFLLDQIRRAPGEITLVAIGPLTNVGAAIDRDPVTFRKLKRVVMMGGSVVHGYDGADGRKRPPDAEYNIAMDPAAAKKLFASGVPIFMLPLDSTQLPFDAKARSMLASISTPLTDSLLVLTAEWSRGTGRKAPTLFDPVAVAYALDANTCPVTPVHIDVDGQGFTRQTAGAPNAQACLAPHPELFFPLLSSRLLHQEMVGTRSCLAPKP